MALFKISKGEAINLPLEKKEGNCWFTTDERKFYIDISDTERVCLNAANADAANLALNGLFYIEGTVNDAQQWVADLRVYGFNDLHEGILLAYRVPSNSLANQELFFIGASESASVGVIRNIESRTDVALKANEILLGSVILLRYNGTEWDCIASGGAGIPSGGTSGQVLTKISETDGDADWRDPYTCIRYSVQGISLTNNRTTHVFSEEIMNALPTDNMILMVYLNGLLLEQQEHYILSEDKTSVSLTFSADVDDLITFILGTTSIPIPVGNGSSSNNPGYSPMKAILPASITIPQDGGGVTPAVSSLPDPIDTGGTSEEPSLQELQEAINQALQAAQDAASAQMDIGLADTISIMDEQVVITEYPITVNDMGYTLYPQVGIFSPFLQFENQPQWIGQIFDPSIPCLNVCLINLIEENLQEFPVGAEFNIIIPFITIEDYIGQITCTNTIFYCSGIYKMLGESRVGYREGSICLPNRQTHQIVAFKKISFNEWLIVGDVEIDDVEFIIEMYREQAGEGGEL